MTVIITADLHFTINPHDEYRWGFIDWLCEHSTGIDELILLGDYTTPKDNHPGMLVNRLKECVDKLADHFSRVIMQSGNHDCCSEATQVLTKRGWVYYMELIKSDSVFGLNSDLKGQWQPINYVIEKQVKELYQCQTKHIDICVSENHRVLTEKAGDLHYNKPIEVPRFKHRIIQAASSDNEEIVKFSDDELRLYGWLITDSHVTYSGYIYIYQSKEVTEIEQLLKRLNMDPTHRIRNRDITHILGKRLKSILPQHEWSFSLEDSKNIIEKFGIERTKFPEWVYELSTRQFHILLDTIIRADGSVYDNRSTWLAIVYKDEKFLSNLQGLVSTHGLRGSLTFDNRGDPRLNISERTMSGDSYLIFNKKEYLTPQNVWCLNVPLGNFLVRLDGKTHFTGNCIDPQRPFWKFLHKIKPNIDFIHTIVYSELSIGKCLFVPTGADWSTIYPPSVIKYIFTHATFEGAISETGFRLSGVPLEEAKRIGVPIISGDIHKPQRIGEYIEYVGAPYHIRFGDDYEPRVMRIDNDGSRSDMHYPAPLKKVYDITSLVDFRRLKIDNNQQAKIRIHLDRGELTKWPGIHQEINRQIQEAGWANVRVELVLKSETAIADRAIADRKSPEQLVEDYSNRHKASDLYKKFGRSLL